MKKIYKFLIAGIAMLFAEQAMSQSTFTFTTAYDTIVTESDTLRWSIPSPAQNAFGTVSVKVYFEGDFGSTSEHMNVYGEGAYFIGETQSYFDGSDCMADSTLLTLTGNLINTWAADDTLKFMAITTEDVNTFCTTNHARIVITYNYCVTGPVAQFTSTPAGIICPINGSVPLTFTPAGGTLSGTGVSGSSFDPSGLTAGVYPVTYTLVNGSGCTSFDVIQFTVGEGLLSSAADDTVCVGGATTLTTNGLGHLVWYSDASLNTVIDSGSTYVTPALSTTTTFYSGTTLIDNYFVVNSISVNDSMLIDHDSITGDDRGGIAVTNNYVYVVGDNNTGRYDLNLGNPMVLPRMDGLFSDLATGELYTLYNPLIGFPDANVVDSFNITQLRRLNDDLTLGTGVINLSDSIAFGWDMNFDYQSGVYAGNGFLVIYSAPRHTWYSISLRDGVVTNLGKWFSPDANYSESWAHYGVAEFDGEHYFALYRNYYNNDITRRNITTGASTVAYGFSDISDMASFTYAPWNNRIYLHHEGGSQFGSSAETLVYMSAADTTGGLMYGAVINCPAAVTVNVDLCTGVEENNGAGISVYPNPGTGLFTLSLSNLSDVSIQVFSVDGKLVYSEKVNGAVASQELDLTSLTTGFYHVRVSNDTMSFTKKLIKK
jgi:hypothetical protein